MKYNVHTLLAIFLTPALALAQMTPVGLWRTIDDETGKEKSLVRILESEGIYRGTVEKLLVNDPKSSKVCDLCLDDRKGQPILGMEIVRGVTKNSNDNSLWNGGEILDPQKGKTYRVQLIPQNGGTKLEVRGYVGLPLIGRTQTWIRAE